LEVGTCTELSLAHKPDFRGASIVGLLVGYYDSVLRPSFAEQGGEDITT
jgi:hypothetical protein